MDTKIKIRIAAVTSFIIMVFTIFPVSMFTTEKEVTLKSGKGSLDAVNSREVVTLEMNSPNQQVKYGTTVEKILNNAPLDPVITRDSYVDNIVDEILSEITDCTMSNYEKVRAIHEYLIKNFYYKSSFITASASYKSSYDAKMVGRAKGMLKTGHGTCTEYSALFMVMARRIGLPVYCVQGTLSGGPHTWNVLRVDGKDYIFDSEVDYMIGKGRLIYRHFCTTNTSGYYAFNKEGNIGSFKNFA